MQRTVWLLLIALLSAGCLGGATDDSVDPSTDGPDGDGGDVPIDGGNNTTEEPAPAWNTTWRNGTVNGYNAVIVAINTEGGSETFNVTSGALNLTVNVTATGDLAVSLYPPGCQVEPASPCSHRFAAEGGEGTWAMDNPDAGEWTATLFRNDPGAGSVDYTLTAATLAPASQ